MCSPTPPAPPDYQGAAQAQGQANLKSGIQTSGLNNPNVVGPYGSQTVTWGSGGEEFDQGAYDDAMKEWQAKLQMYNSLPSFARGGFDLGSEPTRAQFTTKITQPTITQTLSPAQQGLLDQRQQLQGILGGLGIQAGNSLQGIIGTPVDFSGAPETGDYDATRKAVIDAMMSRANEDFTKRQDQSNSDLIARGIAPGSKAYGDQMQMIERARNDARSLAESTAGAEVSRAYGLDADKRKQFIAELLARRQTPLNEISALMSGSQVANPFSMPGAAQNSNIAPAPMFGAAQAQNDYNMNMYNSGVGTQNALLSGLFGIGAAYAGRPQGRS